MVTTENYKKLYTHTHRCASLLPVTLSLALTICLINSHMSSSIYMTNFNFLYSVLPSFYVSLTLAYPLSPLCVSLGDGKDIESSTCVRLPSCSCAVGLRQRPDGHEERVLHRRLQTRGGLPQRAVSQHVKAPWNCYVVFCCILVSK